MTALKNNTLTDLKNYSLKSYNIERLQPLKMTALKDDTHEKKYQLKLTASQTDILENGSSDQW